MHSRHFRGGSPAPQGPVKWSVWIRQFHRWTSIAFTASAIAAFLALAQPEPIVIASYAPLVPLALLALTGLYMLVLPGAARRRNEPRR